MADASDWTLLDAAFDRALRLDGEARATFLASLDAATRARLEPLLADALRDDPLLDRPDAAFDVLAEALTQAQDVHDGERIGPYRIEALVGEGGMGRVYRARRADGLFDQTVAVKVVRHSLALAGSDVAARLRRERDLLATLDHVGIARLLDGGETEDGVPYLVTEFVDGTAITDYADAHGLDVAARVRLMVDVARAVDHAHRRFVVHRDLKPSNVLVAERDGAPRPVVLDFGIAKLLEAADEATGAFPLTRTGLRMLTPAYAAPELYDPTVTVTTAADVYGLGALLYELLTGRRPHDDAASSGPATTEPTRPSKAVTALSDGAPAPPRVAARARTLRGDLDTICLAALHPDPARRYATASAFAGDLEGFLDGRPIEARRDSVAYVARRFVRRNRGVVAAAAIALVALIVGLGASLISLSNERAARAEAEVAAGRASEAAGLLAGLFRTADPDYDDGHAVTVAEAVGEGVARVRAVRSDPLRAYLLRILGETYIQLGEPVTADSLLLEALAIHGPDASGEEATLVRMHLLATRDALSDPERVLALGRRLVADHQGDSDPRIVLGALAFMARAFASLGDDRLAVATAMRARRHAATSGTPAQRIRANRTLGDVLTRAGRAGEAIPYLDAAVRQSEAEFGRRDGRTSSALTDLGDALGQHGETRRAESVLREAIAFHAERYGPNRIGYPLAYLGRAKLRAGQFREAAAILDSAVTMATAIVGGTHEDVGAWLADEAEALNGAGDYPAAERVARQALAVAEVQSVRVRAGASARARRQIEVAQMHQGRR